MGILSSNKVRLIHKGDGEVRFVVPTLPQPSDVKLKYKNDDKNRELTSFRHSLVSNHGAFYTELFKKGFIRNGAVVLDGWYPTLPQKEKDSPAFRTVVQADGDIVCSIHVNTLERKEASELLACYIEVQRQFMEAFQEALRIKIKRVITTLAGCTSILWLIGYLI